MAPEFILFFTDSELQYDLTALHKDLELFACGKSVICKVFWSSSLMFRYASDTNILFSRLFSLEDTTQLPQHHWQITNM